MRNSNIKFKASLGSSARIITVAVTVMFLVIIAGQFIYFKNDGLLVTNLVIALLPLIYLVVFALSPKEYIINHEELVIKKVMGKTVIRRASIVGIEILQQKDVSGALRTFGVGGLFGYFGKFYKKQLGSMNWYATRLDTPVLITTIDNVKYLLSPDEPIRFSEALKTHKRFN